jgi:hypothetical protein
MNTRKTKRVIETNIEEHDSILNNKRKKKRKDKTENNEDVQEDGLKELRKAVEEICKIEPSQFTIRQMITLSNSIKEKLPRLILCEKIEQASFGMMLSEIMVNE